MDGMPDWMRDGFQKLLPPLGDTIRSEDIYGVKGYLYNVSIMTVLLHYLPALLIYFLARVIPALTPFAMLLVLVQMPVFLAYQRYVVGDIVRFALLNRQNPRLQNLEDAVLGSKTFMGLFLVPTWIAFMMLPSELGIMNWADTSMKALSTGKAFHSWSPSFQAMFVETIRTKDMDIIESIPELMNDFLIISCFVQLCIAAYYTLTAANSDDPQAVALNYAVAADVSGARLLAHTFRLLAVAERDPNLHSSPAKLDASLLDQEKALELLDIKQYHLQNWFKYFAVFICGGAPSIWMTLSMLGISLSVQGAWKTSDTIYLMSTLTSLASAASCCFNEIGLSRKQTDPQSRNIGFCLGGFGATFLFFCLIRLSGTLTCEGAFNMNPLYVHAGCIPPPPPVIINATMFRGFGCTEARCYLGDRTQFLKGGAQLEKSYMSFHECMAGCQDRSRCTGATWSRTMRHDNQCIKEEYDEKDGNQCKQHADVWVKQCFYYFDGSCNVTNGYADWNFWTDTGFVTCTRHAEVAKTFI